MSSAQHFSINTPEVVAEVIDGELVAIHLGSGCYYHANHTGGQIWNLLEEGHDVREISARIAKQFGLKTTEAHKVVNDFLQKILAEQLIRVSVRPPEQHKKQPSLTHQTATYQKPTLQKHEDMKELLLLDPIHDIGEGLLPLETV